MPDNNPIVLSVICSLSGDIKTILRDDLNILADCRPDCHLRDIVDSGGASKVWNFLSELSSKRAAADWLFNVQVQDRLEPLYFAGGAVRDEIVVVAAFSREGMELYYDELMQINNDHANALRAALKEQSLQQRAQPNLEPKMYHELMQLNNELANAQRELARKNAHLARLNNEMNQFLGLAAHDLRTPLNVIFGYSQLLRDEWEDIGAEERTDILQQIAVSGQHMLERINGFLDLAKVESGTVELKLQPTDIAELLLDAGGQASPFAEAKQIILNVSVDSDLPKAQLDSARIAQVLLNLVRSAIRYSPVGGEVHLTAERREERVEISVVDQGPGIPAEEIDNLFSPAPPSANAPYKPAGIGLDLSIARRIVTAHGGDIHVDSEKGQGTTITLTLPL